MIENRKGLKVLAHLTIIVTLLMVCFPIYIAIIASTQSAEAVVTAPLSLLPGDHFWENYQTALWGSGKTATISAGRMLWVSLVMTFIIAIGKIAISITSAFAIVYFRFPGRMILFWIIFITLMLPVEVRIIPTFDVVANLHLLNSYAGLTIPLIASATATFLFRQFYSTVPDELLEAARVDGAGAMRFFKDILLPLSRPTIAALFVIQFIYGWNQYLWPLLMTTREEMFSISVGLRQMMGSGDALVDWNIVMATTVLMLIPPMIIILIMQKWLVKGLIDSEK
ncbi:sn-glycerol-3-phosphate ABC transporter permease UgpE [Ignatzschineria cameli]|uniref:sn-glycerol-3-phosphate transport system permease protein UgpE n=1 Tax=Ignatzschineria cameli TaxID=2182793 RepID=A0A2U2AQY4_9GAMM|nr:sn-glycerol-3-phosphate ABC transporter permease UgpE [Ignatzschineria cameli]PWD85290.1 sn-glycerol-3-phosphate ABC transporter permease UgpE [Ignatzschineria cameli]PWD86285.1 sn-glycerol-3-phosphate ABC transporter permease UgpE [Ignatzschineria cameli]PWD89877.1 sn-glycerol-3-phosphate ABC transporter permease UgpE [Ignatzschineria cameli]PWD91527.1 sn-glycerol-3-phosphate ABC transporter permease UgpE [Ignatzschineria cameli]PWD92565.1 sn-glycerol-3-phosphate ABC transporter permease U